MLFIYRSQIFQRNCCHGSHFFLGFWPTKVNGHALSYSPEQASCVSTSRDQSEETLEYTTV